MKKEAKYKILIVEDNMVDRTLLKNILIGMHDRFDVIEASSSEEALKFIKQSQPDLMLLDIDLPGQNGLQFLETMHQNGFRKIPVLLVSSFSSEEDKEKGFELGAMDFINKPINANDVKARVSVQMRFKKIMDDHKWCEDKTNEGIKLLYKDLQKRNVTVQKLINSVEQTADNIMITDMQGCIEYVNPSFERNTGYAKEEIIGKNPRILKSGKQDNEFYANLWQTIMGGKTFRSTVANVKKDGTIYYADQAISPIKNEQGEITHFVSVWKDLSERIKFEEDLNQKNIELEKINKRLQELDSLQDDFVGMVSHELRTPLTIIRESISQITDGLLGDVPEKQKKYLDKSLVNIDRLRNMIDNLLDISKIEKGRLELYKEKVNMAKLIEDITSSFEAKFRSQGLDLKLELPQNEVNALIDTEKVIQVFNNLLGNALKFTKKGSISIIAREKEDFIQCRILDTGKGIAQKDLHKLFNKFEQVGRQHGPGEEGTGLGLAIAKGIIELHGGDIHVESEEGKGTAFIFTLPKYMVREDTVEFLRSSLAEAVEDFNLFSVIKFEIQDENKVDELKGLISKTLYRWVDRVIARETSIYIVLPNTEKEMCAVVINRIREKAKENNTRLSLDACVVTYPQDGLTVDEIIVKMETQTGGI